MRFRFRRWALGLLPLFERLHADHGLCEKRHQIPMKAATRITVIYAAISLLASTCNLLAQMLSIRLYGGWHAIEISVLIGTATGLPIKYILEKKWVFNFTADNLRHDSLLFFLYGIMGVFTTVIFWGTEFLFQALYGSEMMRYLGGALGLTLGSWLKYHLDKQLVFKRGPA